MRKFLVKIEHDFLGKPIFLEGEFIADSPEEAQIMAKEFYAVELDTVECQIQIGSCEEID